MANQFKASTVKHAEPSVTVRGSDCEGLTHHDLHRFDLLMVHPNAWTRQHHQAPGTDLVEPAGAGPRLFQNQLDYPDSGHTTSQMVRTGINPPSLHCAEGETSSVATERECRGEGRTRQEPLARGEGESEQLIAKKQP